MYATDFVFDDRKLSSYGLMIGKIGSNSGHSLISPAEDAMLRRWLIRKDGYHWIHFLQRDFEDIFYKVTIHLNPFYVSGRLIGYEATVTSNCEYGFSQ